MSALLTVRHFRLYTAIRDLSTPRFSPFFSRLALVSYAWARKISASRILQHKHTAKVTMTNLYKTAIPLSSPTAISKINIFWYVYQRAEHTCFSLLDQLNFITLKWISCYYFSCFSYVKCTNIISYFMSFSLWCKSSMNIVTFPFWRFLELMDENKQAGWYWSAEVMLTGRTVLWWTLDTYFPCW